jgi:ADP-ribose pyrophosphatase
MMTGLIDEGETVEQAAIRELREETGYEVDSVLDVSSVVVADPGLCLSSFAETY